MNLKHGMEGTPTYRSWDAMLYRCRSKSSKDYAMYGAQGIKVCERWLKFENFFEDMGVKPAGTSLDRIDGRGNYEPGNCRWATSKQQNRNTKANVFLTHNGKTQCLAAWAEETGIAYQCLYARLKKNLPIEKVLYLGSLRYA